MIVSPELLPSEGNSRWGDHADGLPEVMDEMCMRNVLVGLMKDRLEWNKEEYEWDDMTEEINL